MAHTKGPWKQEALQVKVSGRGLIANCPTPQNDGVFDCAANARLIAAAPDLLAALKALTGHKEYEEMMMSKRLKMAFAAIAKATKP